VELTLEKFFSNEYYLLATASVFDAKYKGSDGVERNSTFNNHLVGNVLAGREFKVGKAKRKVLTVDMKVARSGGRYYTPVDLNASIAANTEKLDENNYNSQRLPDYFRADLRIGFRINNARKKLTQTFYLDFQNVTNNQNVFTRRYNHVLKTVGTINQIGFFPDILFRLQF
jgi:glucose/arabinose dehydrogenase